VKGEERLANAKSLLQVTDDTLPSAQQNENPQSSFVGDRLQEWQHPSGVRNDAARGHAAINHRSWLGRDP
jgi:hypothetical protein